MLSKIFAVALVAGSSFGASARSLYKRQYSNPNTLATNFPDPNIDPFYSQPHDLSSFAPGQVLRQRQVLTTITGRAVKSYEVFYRTNDYQDKAVGTVATIWAPGVPLDPPRVLSYQSAEDAVNLDCTPSWAWVNASSTVEVYNQEDGGIIVPWALANGYYVVNSDFEGPKSAWLTGLVEGREVLDGIRATINFLHLRKAEVGLFGYSGGAHASVWASSLAASYAPELNFVGAAFGGTPVDLQSAYNLLNGAPEALLAGGAIIGLANGHPELYAALQSLLTPAGKAIVQKILAPNYCIVEHIADFAGFNFSTLFKSNFMANPVVKRVLAEESLLMDVSTKKVPVPKFPRFEWHGTADVTVPYAPEAKYVAQQCAHGADIRFVSYPGLDHGQADITGIPGAFLFLKEAFAGALPKVKCGANITTPAIGSLEALGLLGVDTNILLGALLVGA